MHLLLFLFFILIVVYKYFRSYSWLHKRYRVFFSLLMRIKLNYAVSCVTELNFITYITIRYIQAVQKSFNIFPTNDDNR